MDSFDIMQHWMAQVRSQPKKVCSGCGFLCFSVEEICPRCNAYLFRDITVEEELNISKEDTKLDLDHLM